MLSRIQGSDTRAHPERLGLDRDIGELIPQLGRLIDAELGGGYNVNELVSSTTAALDVDRLAGGRVLQEAQRLQVEAWLRAAFPRASLEERFDIARALGEVGARPVRGGGERGVRGPVSVVCVTRMREAALACRAKSVTVEEAGVEVDSLTELDTRPQLCAEFLAAMAELARARPEDEVSSFDSTLADRAVATLAKHSVLVRPDGGLAEVDAEAVCSEALGLMSYFRLTGEATLPARPEIGGTAHGRGRARAEGDAPGSSGRAEPRGREEQRLRRPLDMAQIALLCVTVLLAVGVALTGAKLIVLDLNALTVIGGGIAMFTGVFVIVALLLVRWHLYPPMGRTLAATVSGGMPGLRRRLATLVREEERPVV